MLYWHSRWYNYFQIWKAQWNIQQDVFRFITTVITLCLEDIWMDKHLKCLFSCNVPDSAGELGSICRETWLYNPGKQSWNAV